MYQAVRADFELTSLCGQQKSTWWQNWEVGQQHHMYKHAHKRLRRRKAMQQALSQQAAGFAATVLVLTFYHMLTGLIASI